MAITVGNFTKVGGVNTATTPSIDTTGASLLIIGITSYSEVTEPVVSDSKTNTWVGLHLQVCNALAMRSRIFFAENPTVGSGHAFTFTGTNVQAGLVAVAFHGAALASVYTGNQNNNKSETNVTSLSTGSVTPPENNCLVVTNLGIVFGTAQSIDASFSILVTQAFVGSVNYGDALAYLVQTTAGAVNPAWSWTTNDNPAVTIAVFREAAAAGPRPGSFALTGVGL